MESSALDSASAGAFAKRKRGKVTFVKHSNETCRQNQTMSAHIIPHGIL